MGGHDFKSLFTLSPLHIELPVASPLSLTRVCSRLSFHYLIYLLHQVGDPVVLACYDWIRYEFQTWHTYSGIIPHSPLWYFPLGHHFITIFRYHISPIGIFRSLSFLSSLLTRHYPYFTLSVGFSRVIAWRIVTFSPPPFALWAVVQRSYFERLSY